MGGQTIFLNGKNWTNTADNDDDCVCAPEPDEKKETREESKEESDRRRAMEEERRQREGQIKAELEALTVAQLLNAVLEVQKERALAYKEYDRGLEVVLKTGNFSTYPTICANATASFAVLSTSINTMSKILLH